MKVNKIVRSNKSYPKRLLDISDSPKELYVLGSLQKLLTNPCLSVVGTRKITPYGRAVTEKLVIDIAKRGITIISGLAIGVDAVAHKASLEAGGQTIAVLPCGLDKPYPSSHRQLAKHILENGGALVSEYPPGSPPLQHNFIARNRIVSGLGDAVLVTEAAAKSGTMHTVSFALDQGKSVMAVPGNITSNLSEGTNNLIKTGATPVTSADDILQVLGINNQQLSIEILPANGSEALILDLIKSGLTDGNELQVKSDLQASEFNQMLTMMEINGKIRSIGANHWTIA